MEDELLSRELPKWSRMVIDGDRITPDQAAEIIVRTADLEFFCNDQEWRRKLHTILDLTTRCNYVASTLESSILVPPGTDRKDWYFVDYEKLEPVQKSLGILNLEYLQNHQIASSYVDGPHGWCSWDGVIGCDGYNIGKWPTIKDIFEEWKIIASTWPFLRLQCQLWDQEYGDNTDDSHPVVQFSVQNGSVTLLEPKLILCHSRMTPIIGRVFLPHGERGCTLEQFKRGVEMARKNVNDNSK